MGVIEAEARKKRRLGQIQSAVLATVAVTGFVLVATVAPKIFSLLEHIPAMKRARLKYRAKTVLGRLVIMGLIAFETRDGKKYARLTEDGKKVIAFERQKFALAKTKKRRWDGRWRVIIFDVPERRRLVRDHLRDTMQETGFAHLQDSVWIFPYDCEDFVALLKADLKIGTAVLYMVVEQIENDKHLRAHFNLK